MSAFDPGDVEVLPRSAVGENCRCTAGHGLFEVVDAVCVFTGYGSEDEAGTHLPRVVGDAPHLRPRIAGQLTFGEALEEGRELLALPPPVFASP